MASARYAWGIDVGNRALKAVKLVRDATGALKIDDFEVIEHETVLSNAGDNRESLVQSALANFVQRHPMKGGGSLALGVSGQTSFARFIKLPPVEPAKIPEIVRFEAIQQIPFPLDDVEWSYQLFRDPGSPDVEVGIFAMRKELVNHWLKYFTDIDLSVSAVQMNPLAVYNAMNHEGRLNGTTMLIDLGAENTDLIISEGETIWLRSIPIGGNNFTEALVKAFKLNFAKAEELKRNAPSSKFAKQIFQAMRPIFADLVSEIQRSIGFYSSVHRESRIDKVLALGGTFRLPGLQKYLQQNLQLDVEAVKSLSIGQPSDAKLAGSYNENLLSVASAYGLAVQAMGDAKINSSLLPEKIRRERMWRDKTKWFGLAAAGFVLGAGVAYTRYFIEDFRVKVSADANQQRINNVMGTARTLDTQWSDIENRGGPDRARINAIRNLTHYRTLWSELLSTMTAKLPAPQPALLTGKLQDIKSIPRGARQQILIDQISTQYRPNIGAIADDPDFKKFISEGAMPTMPVGGDAPPMDFSSPMGMGGDDFSAPPTGPIAPTNSKRGFLITLRVTTPFADAYTLVEKKYVEALRAMNDKSIKPGAQFYVARAEIVQALKVPQDATKVTALAAGQAVINRERQAQATAAGAAGAPGTGAPIPGGFVPPGESSRVPFGGGAPAAGGGTQGDPAIFIDRLTGEDMHDDWSLTILVAVVIDPPPAVQTAAGR